MYKKQGNLYMTTEKEFDTHAQEIMLIIDQYDYSEIKFFKTSEEACYYLMKNYEDKLNAGREFFRMFHIHKELKIAPYEKITSWRVKE